MRIAVTGASGFVGSAVPVRSTSPVANPVTGSENSTSKTSTGELDGSDWDGLWSRVTVGGVTSRT